MLVTILFTTFICYYTTFLSLVSKNFPLVQTNSFGFILLTLMFLSTFFLTNASMFLPFSSLVITCYNFLLNTFLPNVLSFSTPDLIYSFESYQATANLITSYIDNIEYPYSTEFSFAFTTKLAACLSFLILIRGGVPRYRYDILTKLGWVKFLGFVLAIFILTLVMFFLW
jgi:hypothetical protein